MPVSKIRPILKSTSRNIQLNQSIKRSIISRTPPKKMECVQQFSAKSALYSGWLLARTTISYTHNTHPPWLNKKWPSIEDRQREKCLPIIWKRNKHIAICALASGFSGTWLNNTWHYDSESIISVGLLLWNTLRRICDNADKCCKKRNERFLLLLAICDTSFQSVLRKEVW